MGASRAVALIAVVLAGACCKATPPPAGPTKPDPNHEPKDPIGHELPISKPPPKPCTSVDGCRAACRAAEPQGCLRLATIALAFSSEEHLLTDEATALRRACEAGDGRTCVLLGSVYCGDGEPSQPEPACDAPRAALLRDACAKGDGVSCGYLAEAYPDETDDAAADAAREELNAECDAGDLISCRWLGHFLATGLRIDEPGSEDAYARAAPLASKACDEGDPFACILAGDMAGVGRGQAQDDAAAAKAYARACALGLTPACTEKIE